MDVRYFVGLTSPHADRNGSVRRAENRQENIVTARRTL
jgi:hypothetical protein